jgi:hypothetical protein
LQPERKAELARLEFVDAVSLYDGERPLLEMCQSRRSSGRPDFARVSNAVFEDQGAIVETELAKAVNIATLPTPEFNEEELAMYAEPVRMSVYVSRGCYWRKCQFCDYTKLYGPVHAQAKVSSMFRPPQMVLEDLRRVSTRYAVETRPIFLIAESIPAKYYRELAHLICDHGLDLELVSFMRVERGHDEEFYRLLYKAGVRILTFGVENASDRILKLMQKGFTAAEVSRSITAAGKAGITVRFNLIGDYPTTTTEDVECNIEFIRAHADWISSLVVAKFDLSCNSPIMEDPASHGIEIRPERDVRRPRGLHLVSFTRTQGLSDGEAAETLERFRQLREELIDGRTVQKLVDALESPTFSWDDWGVELYSDVLDVRGNPFSGKKSQQAANGRPYYKSAGATFMLYRVSSTRFFLDRSGGLLGLVLDAARRDAVVFYGDVVRTASRQLAGSQGGGPIRREASEMFDRLVRRGFVARLVHRHDTGRSVSG